MELYAKHLFMFSIRRYFKSFPSSYAQYETHENCCLLFGAQIVIPIHQYLIAAGMPIV